MHLVVKNNSIGPDHALQGQLLLAWIRQGIIKDVSRTIETSLDIPEELLQIGPFLLNPSWQVTIRNESDSIGSAVLSVEFDETLGRFAGTALSVERAGPGTDITGAALRDMRVAEALQSSALHHIWTETIKGAATAFRTTINGQDYLDAATVLKVLPVISGRTTDNDALNATVAYRIAQFSGLPALKTISEALDTSQSTAKRLVARARELGYVDG